jgi:hypothetical protein
MNSPVVFRNAWLTAFVTNAPARLTFTSMPPDATENNFVGRTISNNGYLTSSDFNIASPEIPRRVMPVEDIREKMYRIYDKILYFNTVCGGDCSFDHRQKTFTIYTWWIFPNELDLLLDTMIKIEDHFAKNNCECSFHAEENSYFKVRVIFNAQLKD